MEFIKNKLFIFCKRTTVKTSFDSQLIEQLFSDKFGEWISLVRLNIHCMKESTHKSITCISCVIVVPG